MHPTQAILIREIDSAAAAHEVQRCFSIMNQLRPHLEEKAFAQQVLRQMTEGYRLVYLEDKDELKSLAGFRILEFLAWGKVLYIDDLITDSEARGKGYGGKLLQWVIEQAKLAGCNQVHLDSGPQRHDAHRLYLNQGMKIIGYHFAMDLQND
jgi:GNAT superfamily N-acetyltransferase